ncbi:MAG: radical SAM protein [Bacteroidota bacterium]
MEHKPYLISWNVTRRCNLNCAHCYMDAGMREVASESELTTSEGFQLLDEIAELSPGAMLVLTGGEPLLRRDIFDLAQYGVRKKLMVVLGTNGYLVTEEVVKKLVDIGVRGLGISLDSSNPKEHDNFRGKDNSWQRAMGAMQACRKWRLEFHVQTSITSGNVSEIPYLIELSRHQGAKVFNLFFLVCTGRGQQVTDISPTQYEEVLSLIVLSGGQYRDMMVRARCAPYISRIARQSGKGFPLYQDYVGCIAGTNYCRITPEGQVTPCPYLPVVAGNLREKSFFEIWHQSKIFDQLREANLRGKCGICDYKSICGGCRARAFASTGNYLAEDSWCQYEPKTQGKTATQVVREQPNNPIWSEEAMGRFEKAPAFVRQMVMNKIEKYAIENGYDRITPKIIEEAKKSLNMKRKFM